MHPRERNNKDSTYHQWCALPTKRALVTHLPYTLPKYMLLDLPHDFIHSVARFKLRVHTLQIQTVTWTHKTSPTCDLCNAHDVQDEQHVHFHCTQPHVVSLRRTYASLFSSPGLNDVSAFLGQENNKLYLFLHALIVFMSRPFLSKGNKSPYSPRLLSKDVVGCKTEHKHKLPTTRNGPAAPLLLLVPMCCSLLEQSFDNQQCFAEQG